MQESTGAASHDLAIAFDELADETRLLFHALAAAAEALHVDEGISISNRAVLEFIDRRGATPVPDIARARHVARQSIQVPVNQLLDRGLVEMTENPAHRRSPLVSLTDDGRATILRMRAREQNHVSGLDIDVTSQDIRTAICVLAAIRRPIMKGIEQ